MIIFLMFVIEHIECHRLYYYVFCLTDKALKAGPKLNDEDSKI